MQLARREIMTPEMEHPVGRLLWFLGLNVLTHNLCSKEVSIQLKGHEDRIHKENGFAEPTMGVHPLRHRDLDT